MSHNTVSRVSPCTKVQVVGPLAVALAMLCLMGCASGPSEYQRGTFTPPAPAAVRPGVGAPVTGQPGMQPRAIPVSPYSRVLPPTREPGIWASAVESAPPFLFEVPPLDPSDAADHPDYISDMRNCSAMMKTALMRSRDMDEALGLSDAGRACLASRLYLACAQERADFLRTKPDAAVAAEANKAVALAMSVVAARCAVTPEHGLLMAIARGADTQYRQICTAIRAKLERAR